MSCVLTVCHITNGFSISNTYFNLIDLVPEDGLDLEVGVDEAAGGADHAGGERAAHAHLADELVDVGGEPEGHGPVRVQLPAHVVHVKLGIKLRIESISQKC